MCGERAAAMPRSHYLIRLAAQLMASNTCRYCSQLVVPANLGTFVDVNVTCLGKYPEPPAFADIATRPSCHSNPAAGGLLYPPIRSQGTRENPV